MTPLDRRLQLLNAGYSPLPLNGKAPVLANWPTRAITNVDEIQLWSRTFPGAGNTGILTRLTPTLDIDVLDSDAADAIGQMICDRYGEHGAVLPRFGQAPKRAILFRTDTPFPKIAVNVIAGNGSAQKIEFLCDGQQVVVDGIHPTTREPYRWPQGSVGDVRHEDLPLISAAEARQLVDDIVRLLTVEYGYRSQEAKGGAGNGADPTDWGDFANLIDHDVLAAFAMKLLKSGMHPGAAVNLLKARVAQLTGVDPERKQRRLDETVDIVASAQKKIAREQQPQGYRQLFADMSGWTIDNRPPREWAVRDRIPLEQPTLFSGEGAVGKSTVELQLCAAHVLARDWLGTLPELGPAIYLSAEDTTKEVHYRLSDIARFYDVEISDLVEAGFHYISRAGEDALLGMAERNGKVIPTPLYDLLLEMVGDLKPVHLGIDSSADVFGGNEIDRAHTRQFVAMLRKLAMVGHCAVVLLSHPSLTGINTGSGLSGSTHWHNGMRSRLYMHGVKATEGEQPDDDLREIEFLKNQYGPKEQRIVLRYRNGLYLPLAGVSSLDKAAHEQRIENVFLAALRKREEQNRPVMPGRTSPDHAPKVFATMAEGKAYTAKDYEQAMERLIERRLIHVGSDGKPSRSQKVLRSGPPPSKEE